MPHYARILGCSYPTQHSHTHCFSFTWQNKYVFGLQKKLKNLISSIERFFCHNLTLSKASAFLQPKSTRVYSYQYCFLKEGFLKSFRLRRSGGSLNLMRGWRKWSFQELKSDYKKSNRREKEWKMDKGYKLPKGWMVKKICFQKLEA